MNQRPEASASLTIASAVMAPVFTRARTPSVPKIPAIAALPRQIRTPDRIGSGPVFLKPLGACRQCHLNGQRLSCLGHIMDTQNLASLRHRRHGKAKRTGKPLVGRLTRRQGGNR